MSSARENPIELLTGTLRTRLLTMGSKAQQALGDACLAVRDRDLPRAAAVLDGEADIDNLENEIDESSLNILVRTQPVARDLRFVMSAVRMVQDLERIGDEAVIIAERATLTEHCIPASVGSDLTRLTDRAKDMLDRAMAAFRDADAALAVSRSDDETAQLMIAIIQKLMEDVRRQAVDPWESMHIVLVTRALDRICRRAENIAEHTYFMVEGVSLKHRRGV